MVPNKPEVDTFVELFVCIATALIAKQQPRKKDKEKTQRGKIK